MSNKILNMPFFYPKKLLNILIPFFIGGGILTIITVLALKNATVFDYLKFGFLNGLAFTIFAYGNGYLADWIDNYIPWTENILKRLIVSFLATVVYTAVAWVFVIWIWIAVDEGQILTPAQMVHVIPRNINALLMSLGITFIVSTFMHGRSFLINWRETLVETEKLKKDHIAAQYETLKNQVNPHFLFNSFNVLTTLVHKDADLAEQFVRQLSTVYRYVLDSRDKEIVPLDMELKELEAYIFLMKIRFGESLKATINAINTVTPSRDEAKGIKGVSVAPLTLQMLVENALKHNEVSKAHPLSIEVFREGDYIVVKNNLQLKNNVGESTGVGLENIKSRYRFLTEKAVIINKNNNYFEVKIPIIAS